MISELEIVSHEEENTWLCYYKLENNERKFVVAIYFFQDVNGTWKWSDNISKYYNEDCKVWLIAHFTRENEFHIFSQIFCAIKNHPEYRLRVLVANPILPFQDGFKPAVYKEIKNIIFS